LPCSTPDLNNRDRPAGELLLDEFSCYRLSPGNLQLDDVFDSFRMNLSPDIDLVVEPSGDQTLSPLGTHSCLKTTLELVPELAIQGAAYKIECLYVAGK
jgi:hypothetical protein